MLCSMIRRSRFRSPRAVGLLAVMLAPVLAACSQGASADAAPGATVGATIPSFELPRTDGGSLASRALRGKVVLYDFWATWCTPCHVQSEILERLRPSAEAAGAVFVAIDTGEPEKVVREYLARKPYSYPVLLDVDEKVGAQLEVLGLPTLLVTDRDGKIVWRQTGLADESAVRTALAAAGLQLEMAAATR